MSTVGAADSDRQSAGVRSRVAVGEGWVGWVDKSGQMWIKLAGWKVNTSWHLNTGCLIRLNADHKTSQSVSRMQLLAEETLSQADVQKVNICAYRVQRHCLTPKPFWDWDVSSVTLFRSSEVQPCTRHSLDCNKNYFKTRKHLNIKVSRRKK